MATQGGVCMQEHGHANGLIHDDCAYGGILTAVHEVGHLYVLNVTFLF